MHHFAAPSIVVFANTGAYIPVINRIGTYMDISNPQMWHIKNANLYLSFTLRDFEAWVLYYNWQKVASSREMSPHKS